MAGGAAAPEFKVLLTGESGVGKSSILLRFTEDEFDEEQGATIGMDFRQRSLAVDGGATATLTLWDTAGQERYRCLTANYYRGTHGICIVYDVTRRDSFAACETWLAEARQNCGSGGGGGGGAGVDRTASSSGGSGGSGGSSSGGGGRDPVLLLVANKIDLAEDRQVAREEGAAFAEAHGMLFLECSAKTTTGVQQVFEELARKVFENPQLWDPAAQRAAAAAAAAGGGGGGGVAGNSSRVDIGAPGGGAGGEQGYCPC